MNFKEILKKYWFLFVVALGLFVFLIVFIVQQVKAKPVYVSALQENGKSVVYTLNGENYLADDLYNDLKEDVVLTSAYLKWSKDVINKAVKTTDELNQYATNYAAYITQNNDQETIDSYLKQSGYKNGADDILEYCLDIIKSDQLCQDYFSAHYDTYVKYVVDANKPKKVWHILVKVENVASSTDGEGNSILTASLSDEEKAKLEEVQKAVASQDWNEVAAKYSDDTSNASDGGYLGIYDNQTAPSTFVTEFANAVVAQEYGTVSEPVLSEFGYHFIKVEEPAKDEICNDDQFMSEVTSSYQYASAVATKEKSDELGFVIVDEDLKAFIDNYLKNAEDELKNIEETISEVQQ